MNEFENYHKSRKKRRRGKAKRKRWKSRRMHRGDHHQSTVNTRNDIVFQLWGRRVHNREGCISPSLHQLSPPLTWVREVIKPVHSTPLDLPYRVLLFYPPTKWDISTWPSEFHLGSTISPLSSDYHMCNNVHFQTRIF